MSTPVVPFPEISKQKRTSADSQTTTAPLTQKPTTGTAEGLQTLRVEGTAALAPIPIDVLYPAVESNRSDLLQALQILPRAITALEKARDFLRANDLMQSDHHVHEVQLLLPELFARRAIGDGFGAIINAMEIALVNRHGEPLTEKQIIILLRTLKELRARPFVSFSSAQQPIEELESEGLQVDPAVLGDLLDAPE